MRTLSPTALDRGWSLALFLLGLAFAASVPAARAGSSPLFLEAVADLRQLDPAVRRVEARILRRGGVRTDCGPVPEGDLVAFYCPRERTVFALASSIARVASAHGAAGVRYLAAHELAHGRQHAVTGFSGAIVRTAVLDELQADCIAGAYLRQAYGYTAESDAGRQLQQFAYSIGDSNLLHSDWHGNPRLWVAALRRGLNQGDASRCLSSERFNYGSLLLEGVNWLRQWRGR